MAGKTWSAEDIERWKKSQVNNAQSFVSENKYEEIPAIKPANDNKQSTNSRWTAEDVAKRALNKSTSTSISPNTGTQIDVDRLIATDYKMSKDERKEARKYAKDWMKDYTEKLRKGEISQTDAANDLLDVNSDYYKIQQLENKSKPLSAFSIGVLSGMPFVDFIADKGAKNGNLTAELFAKNRDNAQTQNKGANIAGNLAGSAATYSALSPVLQSIPALNNVTGKAAGTLAKLPGLSKVGSAPIQNILNDMSVDVLLDTLPSIAKDVSEGDSASEVAKNAVANIGMNLAGNVIGEGLSGLSLKMLDKLPENLRKGVENGLENATEAKASADTGLKEMDVQTKAEAPIETPEVAPVLETKPTNFTGTGKLKKVKQGMEKLVGWYGDDASKAELVNFNNALAEFEETGSMDAFNRMMQSATIIDNGMQGKTYTTPDKLNKNGSLKRKGVTYTYGDSASVEGVLEDALDALDEIYSAKNVDIPQTNTVAENQNLPVIDGNVNSTNVENDIQQVGKIKEESYGKNVRKGRVENVDETVQNQFINEPQLYEQLSNASTIEKAQRIYDSGNAEAEVYRLLDLKDPASIPLGNKVMSDMIEQGRHDDAVQLLRSMSAKLRESGQFSQAAAITMMKSDPETALRYAIRDIDNLNMEGQKKYGKKWKDFKLTENEIEAFGKIKAGDTEAIKELYDRIGSRIAKEYPATFWEKFVELTRISMLLNSRTNIRNIVSNAMLMPVRSVTDRVSALGQNAIHLINPDFKVTQSLTGGGKEEKQIAKEVWKYAKESLLEGTSKYEGLSGIDRDKQVFKGTFTPKIFNKAIERANKAMGKDVNNSLLETARNLTYYLLEKGDEPFVEKNFVNRLASYMKAQGIKSIDEIPEEAITLAKDEALKATFKDDNKFTKMLSGNKKNLGKGGEVILPFTKTPANLAMRGIDYSPAGIASTLKQLKNGADGAKVMDYLSKNITGTAAIALGYLLFKNGIITGALSEDKDEAAFQKQQGQLAYSIKIGDNYYTYDWAQPAAIPIILGATIAQAIDEMDSEEKTLLEKAETIGNIVHQGVTSAADAWVELSPLQTVSDIFDTSNGGSVTENVMNEFMELPQRLIPAVAGATARAIDTTQRQTYSAGNPLQTQFNTAISKIPVLSKTLPAAYDTWGNEIKRSDNGIEAVVAQFASPGQLGNDASTPIDSEIERLYSETENNAVFPRKSAWTVDGKKLDNKQYSNLQKKQGELSYEIASALIDSSEYEKLNDDERAEILSDIYSLSKAIAENKVVGKDIANTYTKTNDIYNKYGADVLVSWYALNQTGDRNGKGGIDQSEAKLALDRMKLANLQRAYMWQLLNSGWSEKNNPYK